MDRNWMWAWRWLAGLALLAVLIGSLAPGHVTVVPFDLPDQKHFLAYAVLGFLFVMAFQANWWQALLVVLGLALIGFGVELAQDVIPKRYFRWVDVWANAQGASVGGVVGWFVCWLGRGEAAKG